MSIELSKAILSAINYIEEEKNKYNIKPQLKTITSFLKGNTKSPFYDTVYKNHPDVCGLYKSITDIKVSGELEVLVGEGKVVKELKPNGKFIYFLVEKDIEKNEVSNNIIENNCEMSKISEKNEVDSFFDKATASEQKVLIQFKELVLPLLPEHAIVDKSHTYGVAPIPKSEDEIVYKRCWISRDQKTRKLNLKYRVKPGDNIKVLPLRTIKECDEAWRQLLIAYSNTIDVETITKRIKKKDAFNEYSSEYVSDIELMPHQKAGVELANKYDHFAFFYDTGTGKTIMALEIMARKYATKGIRFLIIAPKPLVKSAWMEDSKYYKKMKIMPLSRNITVEDYAKLYDEWQIIDGKDKLFQYDEDGNILKIPAGFKEDLMNYLYDNAQHFIINIEAIREPKKGEELLKKINCQGMIIDESTIIKNYYGENAKRMRVFAKRMNYVYLLSGKPAPNSTVDYYSQMVIVDPKTFNIKYTEFVDKYFKPAGYGRFVDKNQHTRSQVAKMVGNRSIIVKKEDCLNLPKTIHQRRDIELDEESLKFYNEVLQNMVSSIITLDDENLSISKLPKFANIMKLREIASGIYIEGDNKYRLSKNKIDAIKDLLNEIGYQNFDDDTIIKRNQVIIWCSFKFEIEELEKELTKDGYTVVTAYGDTGNKLDDNIKTFKDGKVDIMLANPETLKYGVTFIKCHYAIFASMSYSYDSYYQAHDRIYRKGQKETCFFFHIISSNTIDEIIYKCIMEKQDKTKVFERLIRSASKHGVDKKDVEQCLKISKNIAIN